MSDSKSAHSGTTAKSPVHAPAAVLCFQRNMKLLHTALIMGDLGSARSSFAALRALAPSTPAPSVPMAPAAMTSGTHAFVSLHLALENEDLDEARRAFLSLLSALRSPPPSQPRHRPQAGHRPSTPFHGDYSTVARFSLR